MIPTLEELRKQIHDKLNELRCIQRCLITDKFEEAWNQLDDDQKMLVNNQVAWGDKKGIVFVLKEAFKKTLGEMNMNELRNLARKRGLIGFMQMSKVTLLQELSKLEGANYDEE